MKWTKILSTFLLALLLITMTPFTAMAENISPQIPTPSQLSQKLSLGFYHSAVIKADGSLWMWGRNQYGQLGDGTYLSSATPIKVMDDVISVSLGTSHSAAIKSDGSLWMWGLNFKSKPEKVMDDVIYVELGGFHSAAIKSDSSLWMWGNNRYGQLGCGYTSTGEYEPIKVMEDVTAVNLGKNHSSALKSDGSFWIWGNNEYGQLGTGYLTDKWVPIQRSYNITAMSLGGEYSGYIMRDGTLATWGHNNMGQLGDGSGGYFDSWQLLPTKMMSDAQALSFGDDHSAAIKTDGTLWMWGDDWEGQLGTGTEEWNHFEPAPVQIMSDVAGVSLGGEHSAAVKTDGSLWIWGDNQYGQLGNGESGSDASGHFKRSTVPIEIMPAGSIFDTSIHVTGITLSHTDTTLTAGETMQLTATIIPNNATNKAIIWSSADNTIATVDSEGFITAVAEGDTVITATTEDNGLSAKCFVHVHDTQLGDVNADGVINASDALEALRHSVKEIVLSDAAFVRADVNNNKTVDASDALQILRYSVKEISHF